VSDTGDVPLEVQDPAREISTSFVRQA
jgi:hypothetical protein